MTYHIKRIKEKGKTFKIKLNCRKSFFKLEESTKKREEKGSRSENGNIIKSINVRKSEGYYFPFLLNYKLSCCCIFTSVHNFFVIILIGLIWEISRTT